ncbi:MFS transporter [Streptomyces sp. NA04227]|uniref:MFS transporter n=1 Tax=Streptomyces sp. NA04227 TaxID=2742136 RepID=UPI0020CA7186|nr:MFS transporter [Streptomyces sp. NA04227]
MAPTVLALGTVSLVTDASAEMVTAVLPMYLVYGLGVGFLQLGALDGLYTGATALFRLGGGYLADRLDRPKAVATAGYALSALTRLGLPAMGTSAAGMGLMVAADRTGKGLRTAPRDALITAAATEQDLGRAFGVHRTMDTCGALLGPLLAFGVLAAVPGGYDTAFLVSFCLAAAGVVIMVCFVDGRLPAAAGERLRGLRDVPAALRQPEVRRCVWTTAVLGAFTVGDMTLFVALQQRLDAPVAALPLLPLITAFVFMAAATPTGRLADRIGRRQVFVRGHVLLACAYLFVLAAPCDGWPAVAVVLALHGLFYAATDGVLMAYVAPHLPEQARTTGLAAVQSVQALCRALGAIAFGALAAWQGLPLAFAVFAVGLGAALAWLTLRPVPEQDSAR